MNGVPRSWLFTPGARPDRFAKAMDTAAEAVILDLEDAVAEERKPQARQDVLTFLAARAPAAPQVAVRINPLGRTVGLEDLAALARAPVAPDYVVVPKAEEPVELALAARVLADAGSRARLVALVESARGVAQADRIAQGLPRLAALAFGAADYAADLGQQVGVFDPAYARATIVNAAAAGGIVAIDSPFFAVDRPDALTAECRVSRRLGFHGKAAIHPGQLAAIGHIFGPTGDEQASAQRILQAAPDGVGVLDGKMIDIAMVRWAERIAGPAGGSNA
jgi:citrate lyase beta subunit